jgi:hypothetical protein
MVLFDPFWPTYASQIQAQRVARTPFRTVSEGVFSEVHGSKQPIGRGGRHSTTACLHPRPSKRGDLVTVVAPLCIKELRLVTMQLPEKFLPHRTGGTGFRMKFTRVDDTQRVVRGRPTDSLST